MKIKPLKWDDAGNISMAKTPFGNYRVVQSMWGAACCFLPGTPSFDVFDLAGATRDEAKRAAESHWVNRVRQCIEDEQQMAAQVSALRKDAERVDWLTRHVSGKALREAGVVWPAWSEAGARTAIDEAIAVQEAGGAS